MLRFHSTVARTEVQIGFEVTKLPEYVDWIDALRPTRVEIAFLERLLGIALPTVEDLSEIETSSRLYRENGHLFMSMPMIVRLTSGLAQTSPLGLILCRDYLLTIRYKRMKPFEAPRYGDPEEYHSAARGPRAFIAAIEGVMDQCSDELENIDKQIDAISETVFEQGVGSEDGASAKENGVSLRKTLGAISGNGYMAAKVGDVLLWTSRVLPFVSTQAATYLSPDEKMKIKSLTRDASAMMEHGRAQADRNHFMLDATLGLTNVEQNNIFRLLTVVSVIGIPPTLIASMYGMNFKNMPELEWPYGYAWGLTLIVMSALIPAIWFKKRGWW